MMKRSLQGAWLVVCSLTTFTLTPRAQNGATRLSTHGVKEVIVAMTLQEKVLLLIGMGFNLAIRGLPSPSEEDRKIPEKMPGAAGRTHAITRLGIPSLTLADGPAGVRISQSGQATALPCDRLSHCNLLATSWDVDLIKGVGVP